MNEQTPSVIVITPDDIGFATPDENKAAQILGAALFRLVDFVQSKQPELRRNEAMMLTVALLNELLVSVEDAPDATTELQEFAAKIIQARN